MTKKFKLLLSTTLIASLFTACGGGGSSSSNNNNNLNVDENILSEFNNATMINLSQLEDYNVITGASNNLGKILRDTTSKKNNSNLDTKKVVNKLSEFINNTIKESNSLKLAKSITSNEQKKTSRQVDTFKNEYNGNISGTLSQTHTQDSSTGKISGTFIYKNYKNKEVLNCEGETGIDSLNGTLSYSGKYSTDKLRLEYVTYKIETNFDIDDSVFLKGSLIKSEASYTSNTFNDTTITATIIAVENNKRYGFKNYKIRSYEKYEDNKSFEFTYPIEGNIYVNDIKNYFSIDTNYSHSQTPTKEDQCGITYSGEEHYIGQNSNLTMEVKSVNKYDIEIDQNNDNITDTTKSGVFKENLAPNAGTISFPSSIYANEKLSVSHKDVYGFDDEELTITYTWKINDKLYEEYKNLSELPIGVLKSNDKVTVKASISNGEKTVSTEEISLVISDRPTEATITNLPKQINYSETLKFNVSLNDPDEVENKTYLAFGPQGMKIDDNGNVTWKVNELMLTNKATYHFGFKTANNNEIIEKSIEVINENKQFPIARSGVEVPYKNYSLWVGNFDEDNKNELLSLGNKSQIMLLDFDGSKYTQKWLYPFALPFTGDLNQILPVDINKDNKKEIVAISEKGISYISDLKSLATIVYKAKENEKIFNAAIADIDNDGKLEIAFTSKENYNYKLQVYEIAEKKIDLNIVLNKEAKDIVIGNVDNDDSLEMVLSSGHIYDGKSGLNEWQYSSEFGSKLAVGDINNDGLDEIVGTNGWEKPKVFSASKKSELWELDNTDVCTLNIINVDSDPQEEILLGDCQWGDVYVYDAKTSNPIKQEKWSSQEHSSISITAGDITNDGKKEIIWGSGITSSGEDILVIATQGNEEPFYNKKPSQLDEFATAGWANTSENKKEAVFIVPKTDSGYEGQRIIKMNIDGKLTLSNEIGSNWDRSYHSKIVDYDKDGISEIFMASSTTYNGTFKVIQLDNFSTKYDGYGGNHDTTVRQIEAIDLNNDNSEDILFVDNSKVIAMDILNQTNIWTSVSFSGGVQDIAVINKDSNSAKIVIASGNETTIWAKENTNYLRKFSTDIKCERILQIKLEEMTSDGILCLNKDEYYYDEESSFTLFNSELKALWTYKIKGNVQDLKVDEKNPNNLFVIVKEDNNSYSNENSIIKLISSKYGNTIWSSPAFPGIAKQNSIVFTDNLEKKQIIFSTKKAMYISR